jgi:hypothetical protein
LFDRLGLVLGDIFVRCICMAPMQFWHHYLSTNLGKARKLVSNFANALDGTPLNQGSYFRNFNHKRI